MADPRFATAVGVVSGNDAGPGVVTPRLLVVTSLATGVETSVGAVWAGDSPGLAGVSPTSLTEVALAAGVGPPKLEDDTVPWVWGADDSPSFATV